MLNLSNKSFGIWAQILGSKVEFFCKEYDSTTTLLILLHISGLKHSCNWSVNALRCLDGEYVEELSVLAYIDLICATVPLINPSELSLDGFRKVLSSQLDFKPLKQSGYQDQIERFVGNIVDSAARLEIDFKVHSLALNILISPLMPVEVMIESWRRLLSLDCLRLVDDDSIVLCLLSALPRRLPGNPSNYLFQVVAERICDAFISNRISMDGLLYKWLMFQIAEFYVDSFSAELPNPRKLNCLKRSLDKIKLYAHAHNLLKMVDILGKDRDIKRPSFLPEFSFERYDLCDPKILEALGCSDIDCLFNS